MGASQMNMRFFVCLLGLSVLQAACSQGALSTNWKNAASITAGSESSSLSLTNSYEASALAILQTNCASCHTATSVPTNVYVLNDVNHMVATGLIVPGSPSQSEIYTMVSSGIMPPTGALSASDQL